MDALFLAPPTSLTLTSCPICIDPTREAQGLGLACGHNFHEDCLDAWMEDHNTCPLCRSAIQDLHKCRRYRPRRLRRDLDAKTVGIRVLQHAIHCLKAWFPRKTRHYCNLMIGPLGVSPGSTSVTLSQLGGFDSKEKNVLFSVSLTRLWQFYRIQNCLIALVVRDAEQRLTLELLEFRSQSERENAFNYLQLACLSQPSHPQL